MYMKMFQALTKRIVANNSGTVATLQFLRFNSTEQIRTRSKEIRDVSLLGTIYQEPLDLPNGSKILTIKTNNTDGTYKLHRAIVTSSKILNIYGNHLSFGQRVFLKGDLQVDNFINAENKKRESLQVRVNEIYASKVNEPQDSGSTSDQNIVCLLSHIASEIFHYENFSYFRIVSHYPTRNPEEGEKERIEYVSVYAHNSNLIEMMKENLKRRDRVLINGFLSYKPETDQNGKKKYSGNVEVTSILKVDKFTSAVQNTLFDQDIKSVNE